MFKRFFAWNLIGVGSIGLVSLFSTSAKPDSPMGVLIVSLGLALSGLLLLRPRKQPLSPAHANVSLDARILKIVAAHQGRVSIASVADDANITVAQATDALGKMHRAGRCLREESSGVSIFVFEEFASEEAKHRMLNMAAIGRQDER